MSESKVDVGAEALMSAAAQAGVTIVTVGKFGGETVKLGDTEAPLRQCRSVHPFGTGFDQNSPSCQFHHVGAQAARLRVAVDEGAVLV